ncbi:RAP [Symbiodinium natans]|uniref:RAP protein n=1 Tax=Symbiodinium natans TaxID=878477 RepID=A0A812SEF1_9DINO|nr:RAP [Symbiodinium natans]
MIDGGWEWQCVQHLQASSTPSPANGGASGFRPGLRARRPGRVPTCGPEVLAGGAGDGLHQHHDHPAPSGKGLGFGRQGRAGRRHGRRSGPAQPPPGRYLSVCQQHQQHQPMRAAATTPSHHRLVLRHAPALPCARPSRRAARGPLPAFGRGRRPSDPRLRWPVPGQPSLGMRCDAAGEPTAVLRGVQDLGGQNLSNILWSFSQARLPNHALFQEVARHPEVFEDRGHKVSSQHITNVLWAFSRIHGKLGMFRSFFDAAAEAAIPKLGSFKTQELANLLWTFANQTMYHEGLFAAVAKHAKGRLQEFENFDLSQLLWSFAKVWWRDAELLAEAAQDMLVGHKRRLKRMCAQDLGCVLWAFAMLQWEDEDLFGALAQAVREQFATLKPLDIGNVAWALAIAKQMDSHTARMIADHALRQPGDSFGHDFGSTAEGWVHVLSGLEEPLSTAGDREKWEALKARFSLAIFAPLCEKLQRLRRATAGEGDTAQRMMAMRQELALLEAWVGDLQLEHLGPEYSQLLASRCGLWASGDWTNTARAAMEAFEKTSTQCTAPERMQEGVVQKEGKSYRVGLHQSKVLAWLAYDLQLQSPNLPRTDICESGQVISYGRAEREFCPHWQAAEKLLLPLASTSHSRGGHAERVAMLQVFAHALSCAASQTGPLFGRLMLMLSHRMAGVPGSG